MDISNLKRDPGYVKKHLKKLKDGSIIFTKEAKVFLPKKWQDSDLVTIGDPTLIVGIFAIVIDNKYANSTISTLIPTDQDSISYDFINDEKYIILSYNENDRLITNSTLVKRDNFPYKVFTFIFDKGKVPWFLSYTDVSQIYDSAAKYSAVKFNLPHCVFEMVAGVIARDASKKNTFYRHSDQSKLPAYIPLRSVQFVASNTTAKLIGAYWSEGLSSALVYPSERKEIIEELLRS